ncbi:nucleoside diphosphate kinase 3-like [Aotus nancymaae]|uniref:nucleoside diphosphate kinase 3-like n=1 Tax=Aotus nancymaae TaxID=37293 RepID=UPI0030FE512C
MGPGEKAQAPGAAQHGQGLKEEQWGWSSEEEEVQCGNIGPAPLLRRRLPGVVLAPALCSRSAAPPLRPSSFLNRGHLERTFIAIKLDGMQLGLVGEIIKRFEQTGFRLVAMKFLRASEEHLKQHCIDPKDLPFVPGLVKYTNSGPVMAMEHHSWQ